MSPRAGAQVLKTAAKIATIFVAIVWVFSLAQDRGGTGPFLATGESQIIDAPHQPKRAMAAFAGSAGLPAGILRR